jgi:hypothetical protein
MGPELTHVVDDPRGDRVDSLSFTRSPRCSRVRLFTMTGQDVMGRSLKLGCLVLGKGWDRIIQCCPVLSLKIGGTREDDWGRPCPDCPATKRTTNRLNRPVFE